MITLRVERERDERNPQDLIVMLRAENEALRRELARLRTAAPRPIFSKACA